MGCDIHLWCEVQDAAGKWSIVPSPDGSWYDNRSYRLFAQLADVRNHSRGDVPIAAPRGVPADASAEYMAEVADMGDYGHSHSYHTVAQLQAYDLAMLRDHQALDPGGFWEDTLPKLAALHKDPSKVRIVFFFDN
jgi:hypothetical protein